MATGGKSSVDRKVKGAGPETELCPESCKKEGVEGKRSFPHK